MSALDEYKRWSEALKIVETRGMMKSEWRDPFRGIRYIYSAGDIRLTFDQRNNDVLIHHPGYFTDFIEANLKKLPLPVRLYLRTPCD